ncbi:MAG: hypothetical protein GY717_11175 [Rhodobacteraceae bacterium]|nr:hypothetical protein [Paracoccaceae bacterium]
MTALTDYQRLECPGVWRASPEDQRRDVTVSVGDATLTIYDQASRPLTHWSLPAVICLNTGTRPALFAPAPDATEELEVSEDEMIDAIEKVRRTVERRRPRHGRLRFVLMGTGLAAVVALGVLWLPGQLISHAASVVPQAKRSEIGARLLANIRRVAGSPCETDAGRQALDRLYRRLMGDRPGRLVVLTGGVTETGHLPGGMIVLNRALVEDFETPDVVAGYVLAEALRAEAADPLLGMLMATGPGTAIRLLTTGDIPEATLAAHAETLLTSPPAPVAADKLLATFATARVAAAPYGYARDISGETTLTLIEADPGGEPVLPDADWVSLQEICGE